MEDKKVENKPRAEKRREEKVERKLTEAEKKRIEHMQKEFDKFMSWYLSAPTSQVLKLLFETHMNATNNANLLEGILSGKIQLKKQEPKPQIIVPRAR